MAVNAIMVDKLVFCAKSKGFLSIILLCTNFIQIFLFYWALDISSHLSVPSTNPLYVYLFTVVWIDSLFGCVTSGNLYQNLCDILTQALFTQTAYIGTHSSVHITTRHFTTRSNITDWILRLQSVSTLCLSFFNWNWSCIVAVSKRNAMSVGSDARWYLCGMHWFEEHVSVLP